MENYNNIAKEYLQITITDPIKTFSQRPTIIELLGDVSGKNILDIGCGNGDFDQQLVNFGALITGLDNSAAQIALARKNCSSGTFLVSTPQTFTPVREYDLVIAVLVLMHSENYSDLVQFFDCAHRSLTPGGTFIGLVYNDKFTHWDSVFYRRIWNKVGDTITISFLNETGDVIASTNTRNITQREYEQAAKVSGFSNICWHKPIVNKKGLQTLTPEYWLVYKADCPYTAFTVTK